MMLSVRCLLSFLLLSFGLSAQIVQDDFEGNGNITTWFGDDCGINTQFSNPVVGERNPSSTVLRYADTGGQYANIRFQLAESIPLQSSAVFSFKIYLPIAELTGNQPLQVSLKLQNGNLPQPWETQSEIIKPLVPNEWQTVTFDFASDPYLSFDEGSLPPLLRTDFNRVLIQINGENNNDHVVAYIDDFYYDSNLIIDPVYDQLVWADEFEVDGSVDADKWFAQSIIPNGESWFNNEVQHYTDRVENAYVENGVLKLTAKREQYTAQDQTKSFTSARLNSKFAFTYGRVAVRAKLPFGVGTWPAIWMLGQNINENGAYWQQQGFGTTGWPACGEIDIMEHWGQNQNFVQSAVHSPSSFGNTENHGGRNLETASTAFHVYSVDWTPERLVFRVDDEIHYIYDPEVQDAATWPLDENMYIIMNIAILPNIAASFSEDAMEVDYVRVYQESTVGINEITPSAILSAYPHPVQNTMKIEVLASYEGQQVTVRLFDLNGRLLQSQSTVVMEQIIQLTNLDQLKGGLYTVDIEFANGKQSFMIVKE